MLIVSAFPLMANAKPNPRIGNVYYNMVCNSCHTSEAKDIQPGSWKIEDWAAYFAIDNHAGDKDSKPVSYYLQREYRETIKDSNKAAKKFLNMSTEELFQSVRSYLLHNASDSDVVNPCG